MDRNSSHCPTTVAATSAALESLKGGSFLARRKIALSDSLSPSRLRFGACLGAFFLLGFGFAQLQPFESNPTIADIAPQLIAEADTGSVEAPPIPLFDENDTEAVKTRLRYFSQEHTRLKQYEAQLQRRVDSIETLLGEIDRLEPGSTDSWAQTSRGRRGRSRDGFGGGDLPRAPVIYRDDSKQSAAAKESGNGKVALLLGELDRQISRLSSVPMGAPVAANITSGYGWRALTDGEGNMHHGVDFAVDRHSSVAATADGIVLNSGFKGAYGLAVIIKHKGGFETLYGHLAKVSVKPGEKVCRGQQIGFVGSSGRSTGPHLHYEVRVEGNPKNPVPYIELASFARLLRGNEQS